MSRLVTLVVLGSLAAQSALAAPPEAQVQDAIARGAKFLRASQAGRGGPGQDYGTGPDSLAGLALLEAGTPASDEAIRAIASAVRSKSPGEDGTYQNALALLFLDRLGDPSDEVLIQRLGTRLYLGQLASGGFTYKLPELPAAPAAAAVPEPVKDDGFLKAKRPGPAAERASGLAREVEPVFLAARRQLQARGRGEGEGDNSNTQFGLIGLWVAKRRGVPVDDALLLVGRRFLTTQSAADGGWSYTGGSSSTPPMTCAGLLGVAVGATPPPPPPKDAREGDPFYTPPAPKARPAEKLPAEAAATRAGLMLLGRTVSSVPPTNLKSVSGLGDEYYLLWSIERVAVALGLDTLGGADWHSWGCGFLLPAQQADGSWQGQYGASVSTSFAMLFLVRANFTRDLTERMRGRAPDPGKASLKGGLGFRPPPRDDDTAPGLGATPPAAVARAESAELVAALLKPETFRATLNECRDGRGSEYTAAILAAIPKLPAADRPVARDALTGRLTRMTSATLKAQLGDPSAELRRAAAAAVGVKGDKSLLTSLADRVADSDADVAQGARSSLKTLSGRDFGPEPGAGIEAQQAARAAWIKWAVSNAGEKR